MNKILVTTIVVIAIFILLVEVSFGATISVEPVYQEVLKGENFTVNVYVDPEGSEVAGAQYELYFNNTLLKALDQAQGPFLTQDGNNSNVYKNEFDNTIGMIKYGEARIDIEKVGGVTEPGVLATVTLQAIAERGVSKLRFNLVKLSDPYSSPITAEVNNGTVKIMGSQPPGPFLIYGYVFYDNGSDCNNPHVKITNLNTSNKWAAKTSPTSNYYRLMLANGTDIIAGDVLQFEVTGPDGSQSNVTNHTITQQEIDNGGIFNSNISLEAKLGIFDTGAPESPYPSIMGVHNGTIIPDQRMKVNRIYTYACPGTGGHTEYARIWGNGVDAHANWSGYSAEWHSLMFNTTFTLEPGNEYSYTIRTGSYPQIIHYPGEYNATGGRIRCDEFTDANGKKYEGWIPAIKLWWEEE